MKCSKKLFRYIVGVNDKRVTIDMTSPVINKIKLLEGTKYKHTMCFWTGTPWENKELPAPMSKDVFEMKMEEKEVYVRWV